MMKLTITDKAAEKLRSYDQPENAAFKLTSVFSGGCSYTYNYDLAIDHKKEEDTKFEDNGIVLYLDKMTISHINEDLKLDYNEGQGFRLVGASQIYTFRLDVKNKVKA
ncbi:hypothetical protein EM808_11735 [Niallia taxi]|uniref:Core domain-containing protein n=2 Tax=Niallia taxi TaxID=2499688 RepID=A0A437KAN1_9BACI|nr:hypothetical protein EM808_11735 [Niallia taxi]